MRKQKQLTCRDCGATFTETPNKPGYRNQCPQCSARQEEPERTGGNMVWSHKTAPEIELKPMSKAVEFARKTRRHGAGVTVCLTQSREFGLQPKRGE